MDPSTTSPRDLPLEVGAKYLLVAAELRRRIARGELTAGERLPSERELADDLGVSRLTARAAVDLLKQEGLVEARQGAGTFVRGPTPRFTPTEPIEVGALGARMTDVGSASRQVLRVRTELPDEEIRGALGLAEGEQVVVRQRLLLVDEAPLMLGFYVFPLALVDGSPIAEPEDVPQGTTRVLLEMGVPLRRWTDEVTWRSPTPEEAALLAVPRGIPVARVLRVNHDPEDRPVRVYVLVLPGDRHLLRYEGSHPDGEDLP